MADGIVRHGRGRAVDERLKKAGTPAATWVGGDQSEMDINGMLTTQPGTTATPKQGSQAST